MSASVSASPPAAGARIMQTILSGAAEMERWRDGEMERSLISSHSCLSFSLTYLSPLCFLKSEPFRGRRDCETTRTDSTPSPTEAGGTAKQPKSGQWAAPEAGGTANQPEGQRKVGRPHPHQDPAAPPKMDRWKSAPRETAPLAPQREVAQSLSPFSPFY